MSVGFRSMLRSIGIVLFCGAGLALIAAVDGTLYARDPAGLGVVIAVGATVGVFLGIIYATDPRSGFQVEDRPVFRTIVSIAIGLSAAFLVGLSPRGIAACGASLGILGWLGMAWAQYVDF